MSPGISIVVITADEERNVRGCLESLLAQDYPADLYEVIVVDASRDRTPDIVAEYPRVRLVRGVPKGFSTQKNEGVRAARFDILAFTDADCVIPPGWLEGIARAFADPEVAAAGGDAFPPPGSGRFGRWSACVGHPAGGALGFDANVRPGPGRAAFVPGCNNAVRRSALEAMGGFSDDFREGGEDVDLSRRMRRAGLRLDYAPGMSLFHKPRTTLRSFYRWNVSVGVTKHSLGRPPLARILVEAGSPLWLLAGIAATSFAASRSLVAGAATAAGLWIAWIALLIAGAKPYRLLLSRRRMTGIGWPAVFTAVPFLVWVRQAGIFRGELRKRAKERC